MVFLLLLIFEAVVEIGSAIEREEEGEAVFMEIIMESLPFVRVIGAAFPKAELIA